MKTRNLHRIIAALTLPIFLCNCGTTTPSFHEFYDSADADTLRAAIIGHAQCEIKEAIQFLVLDDIAAATEREKYSHKAETPTLAALDLPHWQAQVALVMTIDEKTNLNPSIALTPPLESAVSTFHDLTTTTTSQSASYGIGATATVDATRKETTSWLIDLGDLLSTKALEAAKPSYNWAMSEARRTGSSNIISQCGEGRFIQGDLKFRDWLYGAFLQSQVTPVVGDRFSKQLLDEAAATKKDVIQDEITFTVLYGGNVNPVWKLLRVSADSSSTPLFGVQRTRTQDLLVTMGPASSGSSQNFQNQALASLIGIAVANSLRNNP
ncbi:MAG TPA: hypothetical protein VHY79_05310 [Rhizomicrobium sp.]|jgi:hypothetical protein|nr:hypothetical protein [Rhizomicrobium sp.]